MTNLSEKETHWRIVVTRKKDTKGSVQVDCPDFTSVLNYIERCASHEEIVITRIGTTP